MKSFLFGITLFFLLYLTSCYNKSSEDGSLKRIDTEVNTLTGYYSKIEKDSLKLKLSKFDKEDKEFDEGSRIDLGEELTSQMIENLEILGKVWGFLKYYHPKVIQGKYNWDYELFRVLPLITNAKNREERNKLLNNWIDKHGKIKTTTDYAITDSSRYSRIINLDWINNDELFDNKLIYKLNRIKNAKRNDLSNYYVIPHKTGLYDKDFERERSYEKIRWDDQGFRILTLFKLWNAIEYCFPYTHYTDIPWDTLLKKFIPPFFTPKNKSDYELTVLRLAAHINDSHGHVIIPNNDLRQTIVAPFFSTYRYKIPIELIQSTEGDIAVKSTNSPVFQKGDIICSINNICIDTLKSTLQPYIISSTSKGFTRYLMYVLLLSETPHRNIGILRDGKRIEIELTDSKEYNPEKSLINNTENILKNLNITYLNTLDSITKIDRIMQMASKTKGLIIDMRDGINSMESLFKIGDYLPFIVDNPYPLWISINEKENPGRFGYIPQEGLIFKDLPKYEGKIVILVNENNQSAGETWAMLYRLSNNSIIIGTQTAGANGNITSICLPGGIKFTYSGLGAYYPHWEQLQRVGVKIDIHVYLTIQDIKESRDVWIEKAIEYINK